VPYDVAVNIGTGRASWVQAPDVPGFLGFVSNRDNDAPPDSNPNEYSDVPPTDEATKFREPNNFNFSCGGDPVTTSLRPLQFGMTGKSAIQAATDQMQASGCTRINVGLMWGGYTLSPQWQGYFDTGRPGLPLPATANSDKALVLMTDGENTVYLGGGGRNNDNTTTALQCSAIKARGVTIYTVGFGPRGSVNEPLLQACATLPTFYFYAPSAADLRTAFRRIADIIVTNRTLKLSK